jgi:hypothetical protein
LATIEIRLDRLGSRGVITDVDPFKLGPDAWSAAQNVVLRDGVPSAIAKFPAAASATDFGTIIEGLIHTADDDIAYSTLAGVLTHDRGGSGTFTTTSFPINAASSPVYLPLIERNGEVLWFSQKGTNPVVRWSFASSDTGSVSGTLTVTEGSRIVTWTGGQVSVAGQYLAVADATTDTTRFVYRVVRGGTNLAEIETPYDGPTTPTSIGIWRAGTIGLMTTVREVPATFAAGTLTAATGGSFTLAAEGADIPRVGDLVGLKNNGTKVGYVSAVAATTLTVSGGSCDATTGVFTVMRPHVASCGALHRGRLYTAGVDWAKNQVSIFPPGYEFGQMVNGIDSPLTNKTQSRLVKTLDVPDPKAEGKIVALLSTPGPLLVLRSRDVYYLNGEYPTNNVQLVLEEDGCVDVRSAIQSRFGQIWAGYKGIYIHRNGGIRNIVANLRSREWHALAEANFYGSTIACTVVRDHLLVSANSTTWCYDLMRNVWVGNIPKLDAQAFATPTAVRRDATLGYETMRWTSGSGYQTYATEGFDHDGTSNIETDCSFTTGALAGLGDNDRLTNVKVTYEAIGGAVADPAVRVSTATGSSFGATDTFTTETTTGNPVTKRTTRGFLASLHTGVKGRTGNAVRLRLTEESAGDTYDWRIHGVTLTVRKRSRRGAA